MSGPTPRWRFCDSVYVTDLKSTNGTSCRTRRSSGDQDGGQSRPPAPGTVQRRWPTKADASVPSHSPPPLAGQGRAERHLRDSNLQAASSRRTTVSGKAFLLRAKARPSLGPGGTIFFHLNQDSSVPNHDRSPRHSPRSPAGRGRLSLSLNVSLGVIFRAAVSGRRIRGKERRPQIASRIGGTKRGLSGKMGLSPRKKTSMFLNDRSRIVFPPT